MAASHRAAVAHRTAAVHRAAATYSRHRQAVHHRYVVHRRSVITHRRAAAAHRSQVAWHRANVHQAWRTRYWHHHRWSHWHARWWGPHPWYRPHWSYGVFVYGPHPVIVHRGPVTAAPADPPRKVSRAGEFSLGVRGGSYMSTYDYPSSAYGDLGLGLAGRYRFSDAFGLELAALHHDQSWDADTSRVSQPVSLSAEVFAFPWTRFNPYFLAGITWTTRDYDDTLWVPADIDPGNSVTVQRQDTLFGPHGGLGIEIGVGESWAVNAEWRWVGYLDKAASDPSLAGHVKTHPVDVLLPQKLLQRLQVEPAIAAV